MTAPDHHVRIGYRSIGTGRPPFVIAELGVNHNGCVDAALRLVDAAACAGADAVKLQYFEARRLLGRAARITDYQRRAGEVDAFTMLERLELSLLDMERIIDAAHARGMAAIATVFSLELVDAATQLDLDAFKTASPDIVNRPLLEALAHTGRPLIVSTGASEAHEVSRAAGWLIGAHDRVCLLQCVSSYPTPTEHAALGGIVAIRRLFDGPVGYSDHTVDEDTGALAVRMHASVLEKHLTLDREAHGPDHSASLEPDGFARYVAAVRRAHAKRSTCAEPLSTFACERRIGPLEKGVLGIEREVRALSRQSVTTTRPLVAGHKLVRDDLTTKRPGTGIEAWRLTDLVGRTIERPVEADMPLTWDDVRERAKTVPSHAAA